MKTTQKNELPATDATGISRYLSYLLRHAPQSIGLQLDPEGWADIDALLSGAARQGHHLDRATLETVCATNDKQRFALSDDGRRIRAVQGHSTPAVQRRYPTAQPPERLYHGTATRFLDSIREQGLKPGARHHASVAGHPDGAGRRHTLRRARDTRGRCAAHASARPHVLRRGKRRMADRHRAGGIPQRDGRPRAETRAHHGQNIDAMDSASAAQSGE